MLKAQQSSLPVLESIKGLFTDEHRSRLFSREFLKRLFCLWFLFNIFRRFPFFKYFLVFPLLPWKTRWILPKMVFIPLIKNHFYIFPSVKKKGLVGLDSTCRIFTLFFRLQSFYVKEIHFVKSHFLSKKLFLNFFKEESIFNFLRKRFKNELVSCKTCFPWE